MTSCRADGKLLKPDKPVSTTDDCFRSSGDSDPECYIYTTHSDISGVPGRTHYYFNNDNDKPLKAAEVYLNGSEAYRVYNWYTGEVTALSESVNVAAGYEGHVYAVVAPVTASGYALFGEVDKYVTLASIRFSKVEDSQSGLNVSVVGVADEKVKVCAAKSTQLVCKFVSFTSAGTQTVSFN